MQLGNSHNLQGPGVHHTTLFTALVKLQPACGVWCDITLAPLCWPHLGLVAWVRWPQSGWMCLAAVIWWPGSAGLSLVRYAWWPVTDGHSLVGYFFCLVSGGLGMLDWVLWWPVSGGL